MIKRIILNPLGSNYEKMFWYIWAYPSNYIPSDFGSESLRCLMAGIYIHISDYLVFFRMPSLEKMWKWLRAPKKKLHEHLFSSMSCDFEAREDLWKAITITIDTEKWIKLAYFTFGFESSILFLQKLFWIDCWPLFVPSKPLSNFISLLDPSFLPFRKADIQKWFHNFLFSIQNFRLYSSPEKVDFI